MRPAIRASAAGPIELLFLDAVARAEGSSAGAGADAVVDDLLHDLAHGGARVGAHDELDPGEERHVLAARARVRRRGRRCERVRRGRGRGGRAGHVRLDVGLGEHRQAAADRVEVEALLLHRDDREEPRDVLVAVARAAPVELGRGQDAARDVVADGPRRDAPRAASSAIESPGGGGLGLRGVRLRASRSLPRLSMTRPRIGCPFAKNKTVAAQNCAPRGGQPPASRQSAPGTVALPRSPRARKRKTVAYPPDCGLSVSRFGRLIRSLRDGPRREQAVVPLSSRHSEVRNGEGRACLATLPASERRSSRRRTSFARRDRDAADRARACAWDRRYEGEVARSIAGTSLIVGALASASALGCSAALPADHGTAVGGLSLSFWPPPEPTLVWSDAAAPEAEALGASAAKVEAALRAGGYVDTQWYAVGAQYAHGFAVTTRLEGVRDDGAAAPHDARWSWRYPEAATLLWLEGAREPRLPGVGRYRVLLVAVTDLPIGPTHLATPRSELTWMTERPAPPSSELTAERRAAPGYRVGTYVYEYQAEKADGLGAFVMKLTAAGRAKPGRRRVARAPAPASEVVWWRVSESTRRGRSEGAARRRAGFLLSRSCGGAERGWRRAAARRGRSCNERMPWGRSSAWTPTASTASSRCR